MTAREFDVFVAICRAVKKSRRGLALWAICPLVQSDAHGVSRACRTLSRRYGLLSGRQLTSAAYSVVYRPTHKGRTLYERMQRHFELHVMR